MICLGAVLLAATIGTHAWASNAEQRPGAVAGVHGEAVRGKRWPGPAFASGSFGNAFLNLRDKQVNGYPWSPSKGDDDGRDNDESGNHAIKIRGRLQKIGNNRIWIDGRRIKTRNALWPDADRQPASPALFEAGARVVARVDKKGRALFARSIRLVRKSGDKPKKVALLFVGHGEPTHVENGDLPITLADGDPFGPHGAELGVPAEFQHTEWAAAYEEIATAMAYIFEDANENGIVHEIAMFPDGDVPPFFTWGAFHATIYQRYAETGNYSPHNDSLRDHVESLDIRVAGARVDVYLAYLDAVPRIRDVTVEIGNKGPYDELVVVPMLLANSTHTTEVTELVEESEHLIGDMDVLVTEPFFEIPYMQRRMRDAAVARAHYLRAGVPAEVPDHNIGVLLASHGTPYSAPFAEFG